ncbi:methyltransferase [Roseobacter sp. HKCCA0434]|uniref:methyltransferase n=1 Tax=Roseobacter sp. HKCCA0434 TaxID=3079297 RepID=UPI002905E824|nr:methyltransferase [Roseobacter sp. HKCCA0434]
MSDAQRLALLSDRPQGSIGVLGAEAEPGWADFPDLVFEQRDRVAFERMQGMGLHVVPKLEEPVDALIVSLGKSRQQNLGRIARAARLLPAGAELIVSGQKTAGIDSLLKQLRSRMTLGEVTSKAHGKIVALTLPDDAAALTEDWHRAAQPAIRDGFATAPGMFSADGPDPGSVALADRFDAALSGRVADLGAGWGWLSAQALAAAPAIESIALYETDADALDAARRNVDDPRAEYHWADVTALPASGDADWVIMNPPFHASRAAEPELGRAFLAAAARVLKPSGTALIVANRHLPYESALDAHFRDWTEQPGPAAFKIFSARRPKTPARR